MTYLTVSTDDPVLILSVVCPAVVVVTLIKPLSPNTDCHWTQILVQAKIVLMI